MKRKFWLGLTLFLLGLGVVILFSRQPRPAGFATVTYTGNGLLSLTNHTAKRVIVGIRSIEVLQGTNWTAYATPTSLTINIAPHAQNFKTLLTILPVDVPALTNQWRVRCYAAQELTGFAKVKAHIRYSRLRSRQRFSWSSLNPFAAGTTWFGYHYEFEVEGSPNIPAN